MAIPLDDGWKLISREFAKRLFRPGDTVLTFNYDCLLEHLLWQDGLWTPRGGYGESPNLNDAESYGLQCQKSPTVVLKLHGSLNFELKTTGDDSYLSPFLSEGLFPGISAHWGNNPASPTLTLPTCAKVFGENRTMVRLWHEAAECLKDASELIIIGYSMPRSDTLARLLLSFFRPETSASKQAPLVVILTNNDTESTHVWKQVYEVGGFGSTLEHLLLAPASPEKYEELLAQTS